MAASQNGQTYQHDDSKALVANTHSTKSDDMDGGDRLPTMISYIQRYVDRVVSPQLRKQVYDSISQFAIARPILFFFIATQIFFSVLPLLAFLTFVFCAIIFSLVGALFATLLLTGVALMFLLPTLFVTCSIAVFAWTWIAGTFLVARWLYPHAFVRAVPATAAAAAQGKKEGSGENGVSADDGEMKKINGAVVKGPEVNGDYVIDPHY